MPAKRLLVSMAVAGMLVGCAWQSALVHGSERPGPEIHGVAGVLKDGERISVQGSGFGRHPLNVEWLGGRNGYIETAPPDSHFKRERWSVLPFPKKFRPVIARDNAYSGRQSILFDSTAYRDGRIGIAFDPGEAPAFAYASWLAYIDTGEAKGQWKMFRLNWECNVKDTSPELVIFNWFGKADSFCIRRQHGVSANFYPAGLPESGEWVRIEVILQPSSAPGKGDGSAELWVHRPGHEIRKVLARDSLVTYNDGETRKWRYFIFQNYQGNGLAGHSRVWMDDIYVQGTRARVEIGNAPNWSGCTRREIQEPVTWEEGRVTFRFNQGGFDKGNELYLYVIDADGRVNLHGFPLSTKSNF